jgi:hypothetical protein
MIDNPGTNRITLDALRTMPIGEIAALPAEQLALLQDDIDEDLRRAKSLKDLFDSALALRYGDRGVMARIEAVKDTGTVRITDEGFVVIADLPKRVKWNQAELASIVERIRAAGDDPAEYVTTEFKVSERAYGAWPQSIRSIFAPARTVETGKPGYRIERTEGTR